MTAWLFVTCILAPGGYCADVIREPVRDRVQCEQLVQQHLKDRRVVVACVPARRPS